MNTGRDGSWIPLVTAIFENALDAVITMDRNGVITAWNPQAESIFGWTATAAIGRSLADTIIPERFRDAHRRGVQRYLASGETHVLNRRIELTALHWDQHELAVEIAITPLEIDGERSFSAFVRDVTERKRAEAALRESEQRFRTLSESLPHLVWTCAPDGYCDYLSRQWVEYTGRPEARQLGYGWAECLHPEDRERVQREWANAAARGDVFDIEFRIRRVDGQHRWFKTRAVPLHDAAGRVVKWYGSNTDIDDFKRSEERLYAQLARLHLLDHATRAIGERQDIRSILGVVLHNLEQHLAIDFGCACLYDSSQPALTVARVGAKSHQRARELSLTENVRIEIDQNGLARCVSGELVHEPDISTSHFPLPAKLARSGLRSLVFSPLIVESKVVGALIVARAEANSFASGECEFLRQLSAHVALAAHQASLYAALQRAYEDLRQSQDTVMQQERLRSLGQMASGIAHDINNALSSASLYSDSLLEFEPDLSENVRQHITVIRRSIDTVAQTVARMREFYRPLETRQAFAPLQLNQTIRHVIELTRGRWHDMPQERGFVIRIEADLAPDLPTILGADHELIDALTNLVLNAVDAMPEGGTLILRSRALSRRPGQGTPTHVQVEVQDTGIGMNEETRGRCLEPFFTTKGERGTGLGLAMVYGMAQRHSADLEIESTFGSGTTMRLTFPVGVTSVAPSVAPASLPRRSLHLLVVDDDPLLLNSLRAILEQDGHTVVTADGGRAGIDAFTAAEQQGVSFEAVITDLGMPYIDGRAVASAIKAVSPRTPIVLLTGWGHRLLTQDDIPQGIDRVLSKPPKLAELRAALAELTVAREGTGGSPGD